MDRQYPFPEVDTIMYWGSRNVEVIQISREDLYEKVWSEPMRTLAPKFGLSDVGLAKVCKKYNIPRPGVGYWAKMEHGKRTRKTPLPRYEGNDTITFYKETNQEAAAELSEPIQRAIEFERDPRNRISVSTDFRKSHPLVRQSRAVLETASTDDFGRQAALRLDCLDIRASKATLRRCLLLMNSILLACQDRGFSTRIAEGGERYSTCVNVHGYEIPISVDERLRKEERPPSEWEIMIYGGPSKEVPKRYRFVPTGGIRLQINTTTPSRIQKQWTDKQDRKIEDCLNEFMVSLLKVSNELRIREEEQKALEEERRKQELIRQEQRRMEEENLRAKEAEEKKIADLKDMARRWDESRLIRAFLDDAEKRAREIQGERYEESDIKQFVEWGRAVAVSLDPLKKA